MERKIKNRLVVQAPRCLFFLSTDFADSADLSGCHAENGSGRSLFDIEYLKNLVAVMFNAFNLDGSLPGRNFSLREKLYISNDGECRLQSTFFVDRRL